MAMRAPKLTLAARTEVQAQTWPHTALYHAVWVCSLALIDGLQGTARRKVPLIAGSQFSFQFRLLALPSNAICTLNPNSTVLADLASGSAACRLVHEVPPNAASMPRKLLRSA